MKKKLLALLSLFLALVVFFSPCICSLDKISAASSDPFAPDGGFVNINMSDEAFLTYKVSLENFMASYSLDIDDYYYFYANAGSNYTWIFPKDTVTIGYAFDGSASVPVLYSDTWAMSTLDRPITWNTNNFSSFWTALKYQNGAYDITNIYDSSGVPTLAFPSGVSPRCFISYINPPYVPTPNNALSLGIDEDGFYSWLLDTTKDSNFTPYLPLNRLFQYLQFYDVWGSSPQKFLMRYNLDYGDTLASHLNNIQIIELKNLTDRLYREFLNSLKYPPADFPARDRVGVRVDIDTNTTDNNTSLITDDSNDSVIVSILRDILRGVIAIRNQVYVTGTDIISGLSNLDFTVNVANNGGDFHFPDLEDLFTPTYSGFDDLEDQFFEKFPFLLDLQDLPEIEDYLEADEQGGNLQVAAFSVGSEAVEVDPLKTRDDLFRFTVPENNNFMNGSLSGMSIDFASFTKFASAIEALKGIISVIALFGFSHWLIKFAPKLLHGYASSD